MQKQKQIHVEQKSIGGEKEHSISEESRPGDASIETQRCLPAIAAPRCEQLFPWVSVGICALHRFSAESPQTSSVGSLC
ncbi:mCG147663 [Mus musculus]|nr:mCG147663 [Mus musculus]